MERRVPVGEPVLQPVHVRNVVYLVEQSHRRNFGHRFTAAGRKRGFEPDLVSSAGEIVVNEGNYRVFTKGNGSLPQEFLPNTDQIVGIAAGRLVEQRQHFLKKRMSLSVGQQPHVVLIARAFAARYQNQQSRGGGKGTRGERHV